MYCLFYAPAVKYQKNQLPVRNDRQAIGLLSYKIKIAGAHIRNAYMLKNQN
jgi:hypothetical protein